MRTPGISLLGGANARRVHRLTASLAWCRCHHSHQRSHNYDPQSKLKPARFLSLMIVAGLIFGGGAGCSRGYKLGASITPQDLTNALPEFVFVLPPGATNLYLEHTTPHPRLVRTLYKVSLPASSLTNFLSGFGFMDEFTRMPTQTLALMKQAPTLPGPSVEGITAFLANAPREAHHASEWNPHKAVAPLRMYLKARSAVSPAEQVIMVAYVDDSASERAIVYLDYLRARLPKR